MTRDTLRDRGLAAEIAARGTPVPLAASQRWAVERTSGWTNAHKKVVRCTERRARVVEFWIALSAVIIITGRLLRQGWTRYPWDSRPTRGP